MMIKTCLHFLVLGAFAALPSHAQQVLQGTTLNSETKAPVPYVNIGIPSVGTGTVSDASGYYRLIFSSVKDSVMVSAIGFETTVFTISELQKNPAILMKPEVYEMDDIIVTGTVSDRSEIFGYQLTRRGDNIGFGSTQLGTEIGARIRIRRPVKIQSAHFMVSRAGSDSLFFRVNLYSLGERLNGRNLIPENLIVTAPSEPGILSVDLEPFSIVAHGDVLLSLEWIKAVHMNGEELQEISFHAVRTGNNPNLLFKSTSHAPFQSFSNLVAYRIGFYMTGSRIDESDTD